MPRKIILDMDPGVDDAVALCLALADPGLEVVAVTATGGNVGPEQASRNVQAIIERIDPTRWPRIGAADPLQPLRSDARDLHGPNGLAGIELPVAEKANRHASVKVIADEVRNASGEITLISTGPMTNVAAVLTLEPDIARSLRQVIVLGGSVRVGGNATPAAEFNAYCDPGAAREVFQAGASIVVVPLDISEQMVFGYDLLEFVRARTSRTATFLAELLPGFYRAYRERFGMEGVCLHDIAAVLFATNPELFATDLMHGDVETAGELTIGATVFDRRSRPDGKPNLEVAVRVDVAAARNILFRVLENAC
ncbi:nucleoside hydrolase [Botrimarina hoheduenensis]|uniref:Pyrimidine-specific ribonucleoside hydrolase RihA n=1 Tax=Botrimarina hoheduenensis TaxID=2528000 RepID=A0A5C5VYB7_9BACT|nr:nucleoside hydrolase [Botrimarina hoheduenensis]TWT42943.1 Pyrimidine-specific ribonucleoside hydrolase RihA [Botrimarina hoheduenensis]